MTAEEEIDQLIAGLDDWRGPVLADLRKAIRAADPDIVETWKWMGSPVWECDGILLVGNAHKDKVKLTFADGAKLPDPHELFNAGLGGGKWRAIDVTQGRVVEPVHLQDLVRAAIAFNRAKPSKKKTAKASAPKRPA